MNYTITTGKSYEDMILETRTRWGVKHISRGFYVLPRVDDVKTFGLDFTTEKGNTSLIFRQNSGYFIGARNHEGVLYVFNETKTEFGIAMKSEIYRVGGLDAQDRTVIANFAGGEKIDISINYQLIKKYADRANTQLGGAAFNKALEAFATLTGKEDRRIIARHSVVIMQMIPEALRFDSMLDFIKGVFTFGASAEKVLIDAQNEWSTLCKQMWEEGKIGPLTKEESDIMLLKDGKLTAGRKTTKTTQFKKY